MKKSVWYDTCFPCVDGTHTWEYFGTGKTPDSKLYECSVCSLVRFDMYEDDD